MRRLTVSELLTATGGTLLAGGESAAVTSVSTDSRKAGEGALFIPLTGERFDGHDYIDKALALGAAGCLCARTPAAFLPDKFYIAVPDTRLALKALASWYRGQFNIPVVQITGSVAVFLLSSVSAVGEEDGDDGVDDEQVERKRRDVLLVADALASEGVVRLPVGCHRGG